MLGAVVVGGAALLAARHVDELEDALAAISAHTFRCRLTGYWPFVEGLSPAERLMEGGTKDRMGRPLFTLEDALSGAAPYCSVSGDDTIFPYGQLIHIANWPGVNFRIVDTGSHFAPAETPWGAVRRGFRKVFRVVGYEPLDICVAGRGTSVTPRLTSATIYPGESFYAGQRRSVPEVDYDAIGGVRT